jgi:hypothetical protein
MKAEIAELKETAVPRYRVGKHVSPAMNTYATIQRERERE